MANWPNVQLPRTITETTEDLALRSEMESGIVVTRPRFTRPRRTWQLSWENMRGKHYRALRAFYEQMYGGAASFFWTHPIETGTFTVRFAGRFEAKSTALDFWRVSVSLEQV